MKLGKPTLVQVTIVLVVGFALALFLHDSAGRILGVARRATAELFLPVFLAMVLAYVLDPFVTRMERRGMRRLYGIAIVYFVLIAVGALLFYMSLPLLLSQVGQIKAALPVYGTRLIDSVVALQSFLEQEFGIFGKVDLTGSLTTFFDTHKTQLLGFTLNAINLLLMLAVLVPLFSFFLLHDGRNLKRAIISRVPNRYFESMLVIFFHLNRSLGEFIRGRFYESAIVALLSYLGFYFIGLKYAWIFAVITGLTNLVPIFGPIVAIAVTSGFALLDSGDPVFAGLACGTILFAQFIDGIFLIPIFIAGGAKVHFMTAVIAIIVGGQVGGVIGMIVAVPLVAIAKLVAKEFFRVWGAEEEAGVTG
jgi:predicted PurR-regulated permease PerM